ncbi:OJ1116_C07.4 [Oryza sativa Japonica Group]|uniref:OJ1116_C07.4 protein n=1 Tax=Oryza sativa subsp. japonica TaxID=39947 RepID=Q7F0U1_ORYSJ|nr:OJ1116_C07.4 [Oryza sativa Japonica Group]
MAAVDKVNSRDDVSEGHKTDNVEDGNVGMTDANDVAAEDRDGERDAGDGGCRGGGRRRQRDGRGRWRRPWKMKMAGAADTSEDGRMDASDGGDCGG